MQEMQDTDVISLAEKLFFIGRIDAEKKEYYLQHGSKAELVDFVQRNVPFLLANESEFCCLCGMLL